MLLLLLCTFVTQPNNIIMRCFEHLEKNPTSYSLLQRPFLSAMRFAGMQALVSQGRLHRTFCGAHRGVLLQQQLNQPRTNHTSTPPPFPSCHLLSRFFSSVNQCQSADLPEEADVVVIGGGSAGISALYHCQQRGMSAILLEKVSRRCPGTLSNATALFTVYKIYHRKVQDNFIGDSAKY